MLAFIALHDAVAAEGRIGAILVTRTVLTVVADRASITLLGTIAFAITAVGRGLAIVATALTVG